MAWASPSTRSTGDLITAAIWNADAVNNPLYLKGKLGASIPAAAWWADPSGSPPLGPQLDTDPTNLRPNKWTFRDGADEELFYDIGALAGYVGGVAVDFRVFFRGGMASALVARWTIDYAAVAHDEPWNSVAFATGATADITTGSTAEDLSVGTISFTPAVNANEWTQLRLKREGSHGNDTTSQDLDLIGVTAEWG